MNKKTIALAMQASVVIVMVCFPLGLYSNPNDIQDGLQFTLEVDSSNSAIKSDKEFRDRIITPMKNRIEGIGIRNYEIKKEGRNRIIIKLFHYANEAIASKIIGAQAQLKFNFLAEPAELEHAEKIINLVVNEGRSTDANSSFFVKKGEQTLVLEANRSKIDSILSREDVRLALTKAGLSGAIFLWGHERSIEASSAYRTIYYVKATPELEGNIVKNARAVVEPARTVSENAIVEIELKDDCLQTFARITGENIAKPLAIIFDDTVYSAPVIRSKIPNGRVQFSVTTINEVNYVALLLRAGAVPCPVKIVALQSIHHSKTNNNE
jgi:SecD/SecF fusion protein